MVLYPIFYLIMLLFFSGMLIWISVALSSWLSIGNSKITILNVTRGFLALIAATALLQLRHDPLSYQGSRFVGALGEFVVFSFVVTFLAVPIAAMVSRLGIKSSVLVTALAVLAYVLLTYITSHFGGSSNDQSIERWASSAVSEALCLIGVVFAFCLGSGIPIWNHRGRSV